MKKTIDLLLIVHKSRSFSILNRMLCLMCTTALVGYAEFQLVTFFSPGAQHDNRLCIVDTDRDSLYEIIFLSRVNFYTEAIWFYEQTPGDPFQFQLVDSIMIGNDTIVFRPWAIVDADNDGFYDMICDWAALIDRPPIYGMMVRESADSFSFPLNEVWCDTIQTGAGFPKSAYDIDQDGFTEFINNNAEPPNRVWIYEAIGDNQYDTVFTCDPDTIGWDSPKSTYAFGDFDLDGKIEFAMGGMSAGALGATFWVYESFGNNQYEQVCQSYLLTRNIFDCFSVQDADGDGRMEFVIKGYVWGTRFDAFIFEATNNNTYEIIDTFVFPPSGPDMCYSDAGDVDGDGTPEIIIAAGNTAYIIKAAENDSFYIFDAIVGGANIRVHDLDRDGDCEIIASGLNYTYIYNYVPPGITEERSSFLPGIICEIVPNPFSDRLDIKWQMDNAGRNTKDFSLKIYDVSGRLLRQFDYPRIKLSDSITWDGKDKNGRELPNGVYLIRLETSVYKETKKIILLK